MKEDVACLCHASCGTALLSLRHSNVLRRSGNAEASGGHGRRKVQTKEDLQPAFNASSPLSRRSVPAAVCQRHCTSLWVVQVL